MPKPLIVSLEMVIIQFSEKTKLFLPKSISKLSTVSRGSRLGFKKVGGNGWWLLTNALGRSV